MIELIDSVLTFRRHGRAVPIQRLSAQDGVAALRAMGLSSDCANVFGHAGGRRDKVVELAQRKGLVN